MPNHGHTGRRGQQYGSVNNKTNRCHIGLPPSYGESTLNPGPPRHHSDSTQESDSLFVNIRIKKHSRGRSRVMVMLACVLVFVALWSIVPILSKAVELEHEEWQRVHKEMVLDIGKLRQEKRAITNEVQELRIERDAMRRKWENEREANEQRRRGHLPFWGEPQLKTAQCPRDRFRRYEARMHNLLVEDDWFARCMNEPVQIAGRRLISPDSCLNYGLDQGVHGYWSFEVNRHECPRNIWDRLRNIFS